MHNDIDPAITTVMKLLWLAHQEATGKHWSLAKVAKQSGFAMSTLKRLLTRLSDAGLVETETTESGAGTVCLTNTGISFCDALFNAGSA